MQPQFFIEKNIFKDKDNHHRIVELHSIALLQTAIKSARCQLEQLI